MDDGTTRARAGELDLVRRLVPGPVQDIACRYHRQRLRSPLRPHSHGTVENVKCRVNHCRDPLAGQLLNLRGAAAVHVADTGPR